MWSRAAYLAGSIATLSISSAAAQPPENSTAGAIHAQGIGATAIVGMQPDSHLNVIMQQRASIMGAHGLRATLQFTSARASAQAKPPYSSAPHTCMAPKQQQGCIGQFPLHHLNGLQQLGNGPQQNHRPMKNKAP